MIAARQSRFLLWIVVLFCGHSAYAQSGSFTRDGVQLFYRATGSGTPIVFLSGGPGFEVDYIIPVADFMPASYQRIFYEQRGTGRSKVTTMTAENMTIAHVVADLEALRIHLKQDRLFLIGHSWGGHLGMHLAAARRFERAFLCRNRIQRRQRGVPDGKLGLAGLPGRSGQGRADRGRRPGWRQR